MQLSKDHRRELVAELEKTQLDLLHQEDLLQNFQDKAEEHLIPMQEMTIFLAQQKLNTIRKSLTDNEIDF